MNKKEDPNYEKMDLHKTTHYITEGQAAFLKRKVLELKKAAPVGRRDDVTESTVIQGLIHIWMAIDAGNRHKD